MLAENRVDMGACDADGCTALHVAAACGRAEAACLLLSLPDADVRISWLGCKSHTCIQGLRFLLLRERCFVRGTKVCLPLGNAVCAWPAKGMETLGRAGRPRQPVWGGRLHALPTVMTIG